MALKTPEICDFGWKAPDFSLPGVDGKTWTLDDAKGPNGLIVMFICNHCPYVKAISGRLADDIRTLQAAGIGAIAIMSNDTDLVPEDSFENMADFSRTNDFSFPYVIDKTQQVGRDYDAICTPDFFGFNADLGLQYRGRLDSSGRNPDAGDSRRELVEAMLKVAKTGKGPAEQTPSMGCSIKWRS